MKNEKDEITEATETDNTELTGATDEPEVKEETENTPEVKEKTAKDPNRKYVLYSLESNKPKGIYVGLAVVDGEVSYADAANAALKRLKSFTKLDGKRGPVVDFMKLHPEAEWEVKVIGKPAADKEEATGRKVKAIAKLGATLNGRQAKPEEKPAPVAKKKSTKKKTAKTKPETATEPTPDAPTEPAAE